MLLFHHTPIFFVLITSAQWSHKFARPWQNSVPLVHMFVDLDCITNALSHQTEPNERQTERSDALDIHVYVDIECK